MMLEKLQKRIKGSRMFVGKKGGIRRLYFRYGRQGRGIKTSTWFEIINDRLQLRVKVENDRHPNYYDNEMEDRYSTELHKQFHELIHNCELERKKVPLHERLKDDIEPVYSDNSLLHQVQALRFMCSMKVTALFGDTGTGKTKSAIDLANSRFEAGQITKLAIFCPVSTKKNFRDEINKWGLAESLEYWIIGIETMSSSDVTYLEVLKWVDSETMIVVDESHMCKTPTAKRSKRILHCCEKTSYKVIMTGTPSENVRDIYMQYAMLSSLITGCKSWIQFEERFLIMGGVNGDEVIGHKNLDYLMGLLEPYTYQVRKEDVLDLPAKSFHHLSCDLNVNQRSYYEQNKENFLLDLDKWDEPPAHIIFRYFTIFQQICCGFFKEPMDGDITDLGSYKFSILEDTGYWEGQTIFFCKYLYEVDQLVSFLGREKCAIFTGQNPKDRDAQKDEFTQGIKQFFVATMSSGGTGLNGLQGCQRIVFFSNSFKWRERKQCIGRIDRQGQTERMEIWDTLTNSGMDYRISQNLLRKGNLADEIRDLLHDKTKLKNYVKQL